MTSFTEYSTITAIKETKKTVKQTLAEQWLISNLQQNYFTPN